MLKSHWFTLVELIVVVTILSILWTIWFISYSGYLVWVRDANRVTQLQRISKWLSLYSVKSSLQAPDKWVYVYANGELIWTQWYLWQSQLDAIDYSKWWRDPKDGEYFTYYLSSNKKNYQILSFLEDPTNSELSLLPQVYAADYTNRYPYVSGKKLGVLVDSLTNLPIQDIDTIKNSGSLDIGTTSWIYKAIVTNGKTIVWTGWALLSLVPDGSCQRIKNLWSARGDGIYRINPTWTGAFDVYCDMTVDGWWWTRVFSHDVLVSLFLSQTEALLKNQNNPTASLYSILSYISNLKLGDEYEFRLVYPRLDKFKYNQWKQTSNPLITTGVTWYTSEHIDYTTQNWWWLEKSTGPTLLDGSIWSSRYYAIWTTAYWNGAIPGPTWPINLVEVYQR